MDENAKQIVIKKLTEIQNSLRSVKNMINKNTSVESINDKLREETSSIYDLKALLRAFSITDKITHGKYDEVIKETGRYY